MERKDILLIYKQQLLDNGQIWTPEYGILYLSELEELQTNETEIESETEIN